ncbi:MAG: hypothetical protein IJZ79_02060 [Bacilli bacterium]|nr:hypothetical protein [Bacilli bacterium]
MTEKEITITLTQNEADECLRALVFRADTLTEKIKEAGKRGNVDHIIAMSEAVKAMQNTMTKLSNQGATI